MPKPSRRKKGTVAASSDAASCPGARAPQFVQRHVPESWSLTTCSPTQIGVTSNGGSCSQSSIALWLHPTRVNGCFHLSERRFVLARMTTRRRPQQQWARSALASSQGHHDQGTSAGDVQGEVCGPAYNSNGYQCSARACPAPSSLLPHCLVAGSAYVPRRRAMAM